MGLKALIFSLFRFGWTRFVKKMTVTSRSKSNQIEVPVNPRCPTLFSEKYLPELEFSGEGVSQPNAQVPSFTRL